MNAHQLAEILLTGNDYPVVIRSRIAGVNAESVTNINVLQNCDSPFEYALLLEGSQPLEINETIDIDSL